MALSKKISTSIIIITLLAAMAVFAGVAHGHGPEQCAGIPASDPYQYAVCHHQSDPGGPRVQTENGFEARESSPGNLGPADHTWERQYASDPITSCIGVRIAAASMAYATIEDEIIDGPLAEAAARSRDCVTIRHGWTHRGVGLVRLAIGRVAD